ncbi:COG1470 family protein [Halorussus ruber]|uniref:COG1470 family protein n=1 Tax=Halorussus ruber TaxID=1126238 RepID=UPI0010926D35|nr:PKD domain-containing protein [Halorussus ruber]
MTRTPTRLAIVGIALLVVASAVPLSPSGGTATAAEHTFVVEQGNRCFEVSPLSGGEDAAAFYDYRNIENSDGGERYTYSSYMPGHLTRADTSRLFLYDGPNGVSLMIVHNTLGGDEGDGSAATFRFSGLPGGGDWIVMDDDYPNQDDRFSRDRIDWSWYGDRTDGAVFRGLDRDGTELTISPAFDERAALYDSPVNRDGDTRAWQFLTGSVGDPSAVGLDMTDPVTIRTGYCGPDEDPPNAGLSAGDGVAGHSVSFDASSSSDNRGIAEYRWDFDGDGEAERTTTNDPTVAYEYAEPGTYNATVTVVDGGGNADRARASVSVEPDDPPEAAFRVGDSPTQGFPVTLDASNSSDDVAISAYRWDLDGDGEAERETSDPTTSYTFEEAGEYEVALTVVDDGGQNATATRSVSVGADDPPEAAIRVSSPEIPVEGQRVVFDATNSTDDTGIAEYRWSFGDNTTATGERVAHTFGDNRTYTVTLTVVDEGGNNVTETTEVRVRAPDTTAPEADLSASVNRVAAGANVTFDAGDSADERRVAEYRWDFDGDDQIEDRTDDPTTRYAYGSTGTFDATVTVVDTGGNTDSANATVRVFPEDETPPDAALSVESNRTEEGDELTFDASDASDGQSTVTAYRWDFDGDGTPEETTENATVEHAFDSPGTYNVTVTVVDFGNNTDNATVQVRVDPDERAHSGGGSSGGGGGGASVGPPPVDADPEKTGPNAGLVDVRNGRADETIQSSLPASAVAEETGVEFRSVGVDLKRDNAHFVVETARPAGASLDSVPADVTLGSLSVAGKYVKPRQVSGVTYEVAIGKSRLDEAGLAPADLTAYQRTGGESGGAWERTNLTVASRGETVLLRVEADALSPIAVGAERSVTVADAGLAAKQVAPGDPVSATATLENEGDSPAGFTAALRADGEEVAARSVTVPAGETKQVTVNATLSPGTHRLELAGESVGNVTVAEEAGKLSVADVALNESSIAAGETVEITATVENTGTAAAEREVALTLFGKQVATKVVEVPAGETKRVRFVRAVDAAGTYTAKVGNRSATLEVSKSGDGASDGPSAPDVPGFGAGVAVVALLAAALLARLRSDST